jgi:hypothetical protein
MKVKLFDKKLIQKFYGVLSIIGTVTSLILIFVDIPLVSKSWIGIISLILLVICYIYIWYKSNNINNLELNIEGSPLEIKFGDLFEEDGLKVIAFNEYFDTQVDNIIIAKNSLNGFFIENYINDIIEFDDRISNDTHLNEKIIDTNITRKAGKTTQYKLGSIFAYEDFLLTAFSHFDKENRAYLSMQDYIGCLLEFWNEIDIIYAGRTIVLPLLGSGITRFKGYENVSEQELLEIILWSFKVSRIKFRYPSKVKIVISNDKKDKISLFNILKFDYK